MKLTEKNYYSPDANKQFMSVSQFKDFCKCEAMAMAKINGEYEQPKSRALLLGSLVDEMLTGTKKSQTVYMEENKQELFKKNGEKIFIPRDHDTLTGKLRTQEVTLAEQTYVLSVASDTPEVMRSYIDVDLARL
jgi:hypothetical protein